MNRHLNSHMGFPKTAPRCSQVSPYRSKYKTSANIFVQTLKIRKYIFYAQSVQKEILTLSFSNEHASHLKLNFIYR